MARRRRRAGRAVRAEAPYPEREPAGADVRPTIRRRAALVLGALVALAGSACLGARALRTASVVPVAAAAVVDTAPAPNAAAPENDLTSADGAPPSHDADALAYAGHDAHHRPRYVQRAFTDEERALLRDAFGIAEPNRLWLPDSSATAVLRYDGAGGLAARVGYRSMRHPGETWEAFVTRIRHLDRRAWPAVARDSYHTGLRWLAPAERAAFAELLDSARAAGFAVRVAETYRAPERQAYLLAHGNGQTFTATSAHQYGRAADILVGDGRIDTPRKVREWIRFRRWVLAWGQGRFHLVGSPSDTWDWPHVELADPPVGFRSVDALLTAARRCTSATRTTTDVLDPRDDPCALPYPEITGDRSATAQIASSRR